MISFMQKLEKQSRIFCAGDEGRYEFLFSLTGREEHNYNTQTEDIFLTAPIMPAGINVVFPACQDTAPELYLFDQAVIFESFPYLKESVLQIINQYQEKLSSSQITIVLLKGNRHYAKGDLQNEEEALQTVIKKYQDKGLQVITVSGRQFPKKIFHISCSGAEALKKCRERAVAAGETAIEEFYEDYHMFLEYDLEEWLDQEFYYTCEGYPFCKNAEHIWQKMIENAKKQLFPDPKKMEDLSQNLLYKLYIDQIKSVCFWDIKEDVARLSAELSRKFQSALALKFLDTDEAAPKDYLSYMRLHNEKKFHTEFTISLQKFFKGICKEVIAGRLKTQMKKIGVRKE